MAPDIQLHKIEAGSGQTLLFVPGWSQSAQMFEKQLAGLKAHYRVLAVDMRGHGDSPKPTSGYRIARLALDLRQFIVRQNAVLLALGCRLADVRGRIRLQAYDATRQPEIEQLSDQR